MQLVYTGNTVNSHLTSTVYTGEHPCQSALSVKLQSNFIEIKLWHECSHVSTVEVIGCYCYFFSALSAAFLATLWAS